MFRNPEDVDKLGLQHINILLSGMGMGDLIACLVAVNFNIINYPWIKFHIWCPDYMLDLTKHLLPKNSIVRNFTQAKTKYNNKLQGVSTRWNHICTPSRTHPVNYGFTVLTDKEIQDNNQKNYLQIRPEEIKITHKLPQNYIVICSSAAEKVKELPAETINGISDYIIKKGYIPVYVGKSISETGIDNVKIKAKLIAADYSKGINLIDKTGLLELAAIMSNASVVVSADGGLVHLAGTTSTPIIAAYTFINPEHNMPIYKGIIGGNTFEIVPENLGCAFCQTNMNFVRHDTRNCIYDDYLCIKQMSASRFIEKLELIL